MLHPGVRVRTGRKHRVRAAGNGGTVRVADQLVVAPGTPEKPTVITVDAAEELIARARTAYGDLAALGARRLLWKIGTDRIHLKVHRHASVALLDTASAAKVQRVHPGEAATVLVNGHWAGDIDNGEVQTTVPADAGDLVEAWEGSRLLTRVRLDASNGASKLTATVQRPDRGRGGTGRRDWKQAADQALRLAHNLLDPVNEVTFSSQT